MAILRILQNDTFTKAIEKINTNLEYLENLLGQQGPRGIQGIPGLPGRRGPQGIKGDKGDAGDAIELIPFSIKDGNVVKDGTNTLNWPLSSFKYLYDPETNANISAIYIDHNNLGFWKYLQAPLSADSNNPIYGINIQNYYTNVASGGIDDDLNITIPINWTDYVGPGWYFFPLNFGNNFTTSTDVFIEDFTHYLDDTIGSLGNIWSEPRYDASTPQKTLLIPNSKIIEKYSNIWISSASINSSDSELNNLNSPLLKDLYDYSNEINTYYPGRWSAGIDRLFFKKSLDSTPIFTQIKYKYTNSTQTNDLETTLLEDENNLTNTLFPYLQSYFNSQYFSAPIYGIQLPLWSALEFWSELRHSEVRGTNEKFKTQFGSLGLFEYSSKYKYVDSENYFNWTKSVFNFSTRIIFPPEEYFQDSSINKNFKDTINLGEIFFDTLRTHTSNQFVVHNPIDMPTTSETISSGNIIQSSYGPITGPGYISLVNYKDIWNSLNNISALPFYGTNNIDSSLITSMKRPEISNTIGNFEGKVSRSFFWGTAVLKNPLQWTNNLDSEDNTNNNPKNIDRYYRIAGMQERGRVKNDGSNKKYLSQLVFYTSAFSASNNLLSNDINFNSNEHNSFPALNISPYRNISNTFTLDGYGTWEPLARLHIHSQRFSSELVLSGIFQNNAQNNNFLENNINKNILYRHINYFSGELGNPAITELHTFNFGHIGSPNNENALTENNLVGANTAQFHQEIVKITPSGQSRYSIFRLGSHLETYNNTTYKSFVLNNKFWKNAFAITFNTLNPENIWSQANENLMPQGLGLQTLYPKARIHLFGKDINNYHSEERNSLGEFLSASILKDNNNNFPNNSNTQSQIIIDYVFNKIRFPNPLKDYRIFDRYNTNYTSFAAANNPSQEVVKNTTSSGIFNNSNYHPNISNWFETNWHGNNNTILDEINNYIGFNIFKNLLKKGDVYQNYEWQIGAGTKNGASIIWTNTEGDLFIGNIANKQYNWNQNWETNISHWELFNNTKFVLSKSGALGLGNYGGKILDAYTSLERHPQSGKMLYLATDSATPTIALQNSPKTWDQFSQTIIQNLQPFGYIDYSFISTSYGNTPTNNLAAKFNFLASIYETIKLDISGDKLYDKNSRTPYKLGLFYPASQNLTFTNHLHLQQLINLNTSFSHSNIISLTLNTDNLGRIISLIFVVNNASELNNFKNNFLGLNLPHPKDFNTGNIFASLTSVPYIAPIGAYPAVLNSGNFIFEDINSTTTKLSFRNFEQNDILLANLRLDNFSLGEALENNLNPEIDDIETEILSLRKKSPKIIFSFLEETGLGITGFKEFEDISERQRPLTNSNSYKRVNTVLASAQNESSLREYWIPKADSTGGTLMVFTDHWGNKEKDTNNWNILETQNFFIEEIITFEPAIEMYHSNTDGSGGKPLGHPDIFINNSQDLAKGVIFQKFAAPEKAPNVHTFPGFVKYFNRLLNKRNSKAIQEYFNQGTFSSWGKKIDILGLKSNSPYPGFNQVIEPFGYNTKNLFMQDSNGNPSLGKPASQDWYSTFSANFRPTQATLWRNIDKFYSLIKNNIPIDIHNSKLTFGSQKSINSKASQFRFHRINSNYALVDWNFTIETIDKILAYTTNGAEHSDPEQWKFREMFPAGNRVGRLGNATQRFTQAIKITYDVSNNPTFRDYDYFIKLFGNNLGFCTQSMYNKWFPGTAIVHGGEILNPQNSGNLSFVDYPHFTIDPRNFETRGLSAATYTGWTPEWYHYWEHASNSSGQPYAFGKASALFHNINPYTSAIFPTNLETLTGGTQISSQLPTYAYSYIIYNMNIAKRKSSYAPGVGPDFGRMNSYRDYLFFKYTPLCYTLLGQDWDNRVRNILWRIVPRQVYNYEPLEPYDENKKEAINSFTIEILFERPILHCDMPLKKYNYVDTKSGDTDSLDEDFINPYKYLTISGQAWVNYDNTLFNNQIQPIIATLEVFTSPIDISIESQFTWDNNNFGNFSLPGPNWNVTGGVGPYTFVWEGKYNTSIDIPINPLTTPGIGIPYIIASGPGYATLYYNGYIGTIQLRFKATDTLLNEAWSNWINIETINSNIIQLNSPSLELNEIDESIFKLNYEWVPNDSGIPYTIKALITAPSFSHTITLLTGISSTSTINGNFQFDIIEDILPLPISTSIKQSIINTSTTFNFVVFVESSNPAYTTSLNSNTISGNGTIIAPNNLRVYGRGMDSTRIFNPGIIDLNIKEITTIYPYTTIVNYEISNFGVNDFTIFFDCDSKIESDFIIQFESNDSPSSPVNFTKYFVGEEYDNNYAIGPNMIPASSIILKNTNVNNNIEIVYSKSGDYSYSNFPYQDYYFNYDFSDYINPDKNVSVFRTDTPAVPAGTSEYQLMKNFVYEDIINSLLKKNLVKYAEIDTLTSQLMYSTSINSSLTESFKLKISSIRKIKVGTNEWIYGISNETQISVLVQAQIYEQETIIIGFGP